MVKKMTQEYYYSTQHLDFTFLKSDVEDRYRQRTPEERITDIRHELYSILKNFRKLRFKPVFVDKENHEMPLENVIGSLGVQIHPKAA